MTETKQRRRLPPSLWIALAVFALSLVSLARGADQIGVARDEAIYFEASRRQGAFWAATAKSPSKLLDRKFRDRHFNFNREHPVVMKSLAGVSARLFANAPHLAPGKKPDLFAPNAGLVPIMSERAAMRLPAQILAALGAALLALFAFGDARRRRAGLVLATSAALLASAAFIALPRVAFHASLHAFDVPVAVLILAVVLAYRRGLSSLRWAFACALLLGIAMGIKLNAMFVGPLLALHYGASLAWRRYKGGHVSRAQLLPPVLLLSALLAPLIAYLMWPWMWSDPAGRMSEYIAFHGRHSYYNMEFLGVNYNRPPMPWAYPWVMTVATVPLCLLALSFAGLFTSNAPPTVEAPATPAAPNAKAGRFAMLRARVAKLRAPFAPAMWAKHAPRNDALLFGGIAFAFLALISLPSVPIFGGTKHWIPAYPFLALLAARAWTALWLHRGANPTLSLPALALVLLPSLWATLHGHPYNLSQYAPAVGGARGAAELGLNRGFWGHAVLPLLSHELERKRSPVYLHDVHTLAQRQYEREGLWPGWAGRAPTHAHAGLIFHELHMTSDETALVQALGVNGPEAQIRLDDVPLTSLYVKP